MCYRHRLKENVYVCNLRLFNLFIKTKIFFFFLFCISSYQTEPIMTERAVIMPVPFQTYKVLPPDSAQFP